MYTLAYQSLSHYIYTHMYYIYICMYLSPSLSLDTSDNHICWLLGLANGDFEAGGTTSDVQQDWSWFDPLSVMDSISDSMGNTEIATWIMICLLCDWKMLRFPWRDAVCFRVESIEKAGTQPKHSSGAKTNPAAGHDPTQHLLYFNYHKTWISGLYMFLLCFHWFSNLLLFYTPAPLSAHHHYCGPGLVDGEPLRLQRWEPWIHLDSL